MGQSQAKKTSTLKNPNNPLGEGTSGVKKAPQVHLIRWIFIGTIPIDIPIAEVMMTSYSKEKIAPKTPKVKLIKPLASSTRTIASRSV